jgi:SAM-dependent methyltransferase
MPVISRIYQRIKKLIEKSEEDCRRIEVSLLEANPNAKLLDLGCADGKLTLNAAHKIGTSKIYGVEILDVDIGRAKANGINVTYGDLNEKLTFENELFDVIFASHVIEHLSNTDTFVQEVYRVIKPGGYLVIATPNLAACIRIVFLLFGKLPPGTDVSDKFHLGGWHSKAQVRDTLMPGHRRMFTPIACKELLECHGFEIERLITTGFFPLPNQIGRIMCNIDKYHATNIVIKARKSGKDKR